MSNPDPVLHFIAGGMAATVSASVTCPLEVVKTRFQSSLYQSKSTQNPISTVISTLGNIYRNEGLTSLWRGLGPNLVGVAPARAIYFMVYSKVKHALVEYNKTEQSWMHMTAAASAGTCTALATNPIWLVKTRMQLQSQSLVNSITYKNSFECLVQVVKTEGIAGLYKGLSASILGLSESTLQFVLYEKLKKDLSLYREKQDFFNTFAAASVAKLVAAALTYPHEVLRTRLRQSPQLDGTHKYSSLKQATRLIYKEEGISAFYGGMAAHLMRVVPNAAIMFFCYELIVKTFS